MKMNVLKAKIKRNNLVKFARNNFIDESSEIINELNKKGEKALIGIQRRNGLYTILGEEFVYYMSKNGTRGKICLKDFSEILHMNGLKKGRGIFTRYKYVKINDNEQVWLKNRSTMESLWNTILWLGDLLDNNKPEGLGNSIVNLIM